jgi:hypothetical protein
LKVSEVLRHPFVGFAVLAVPFGVFGGEIGAEFSPAARA